MTHSTAVLLAVLVTLAGCGGTTSTPPPAPIVDRIATPTAVPTDSTAAPSSAERSETGDSRVDVPSGPVVEAIPPSAVAPKTAATSTPAHDDPSPTNDTVDVDSDEHADADG